MNNDNINPIDENNEIDSKIEEATITNASMNNEQIISYQTDENEESSNPTDMNGDKTISIKNDDNIALKVNNENIAPITDNERIESVETNEPIRPIEVFYKHSFYEEPVANEKSVSQEPPVMYGSNQSNVEQSPLQYPTPADANKKEKEKSFRKVRLAISFACVILATSIITSAVSYSIWDFYGSKSKNTENSSVSQSSTLTQTSNSNSINIATSGENEALTISQINKKVSASIVYIGVEITAANVFGQQETGTGSGSGIVLTKDGYILTNFHVIDGAKSITIKLVNQKEYTAKVIGKDSKTDLAVLKIDATDLNAATFGDSSKVEVGDLAVAIGNPLGTVDGTLTVGVISALNRTVTIDNLSMNLMQTDAAVNPGNSGGALVNSYGEVIGIVNAKTSAVGIEGLGYAIPINETKIIIDELMNNGYVTGRLKIGISTKDITADLADYYSLPVGIYVEAVEPGSAAEKAGIVAKDVIIGVDGKDVFTSAELSTIKDSHKVGDSIKILINRGGKETSVTLVFAQDVPTT